MAINASFQGVSSLCGTGVGWLLASGEREGSVAMVGVPRVDTPECVILGEMLTVPAAGVDIDSSPSPLPVTSSVTLLWTLL